MKVLFLIAIFSMSGAVAAAPDYKYCEITGLANGSGRDFVGQVSYRIVSKQGLVGEPGCMAVWSDGYKLGKQLSAGGSFSKQDMAKYQKMQDFESKLWDGIINNMQLGLSP